MPERAPSDDLSVLADETRIDILRALADAEEALPFSELRERAGAEDVGRFNYHLSKRCAYFVREVDGGSALGHAGSRTVATAEGVDADAASMVVSDVGGSDAGESEPVTCPVCGERDCERLIHIPLSVLWR